MKRWLSLFLFAFLLVACGAPVNVTNTALIPTLTLQSTFTPYPSPSPSAAPSVAPAKPAFTTVEVPGDTNEYKVATGHDYEARYGSGVLAYVKDIYGNWIKASYEAPSPSDSGLLDRLGSNYVFNSDNTGIMGVDGLQLDINKNTATLNVDGQGEETFSTADIHVITKDINGNSINPTLVAMGYAYNSETKTWEVYNPGFPMDSPKDELAWFNQADISNGNWLRWHQRVIEGLAKQNNEDVATYLKNLFADAVPPDAWVIANIKPPVSKYNPNIIDDNELDWYLSKANMTKYSLNKGTAKEQNPQRGGLSIGYLVDNDGVLISLDVENPDETTFRSLPLYFDAVLWSQFRNTAYFTRLAFGCGLPYNPSTMTRETSFFDTNDPNRFYFGALVSYNPDSVSPIAYSDTKRT